ncbi:MAG: TIGR04283 family arsenosugar biosynthesis glycosyltransferase [bacterium]
MKPTLSIIIPVLNEERALQTILKDIDLCSASSKYAIECIVVDGGSEDKSVAVCESFGVKVIQAPRGRGQQLASGAKVATGEVLLFLHADSRLTSAHCKAALETISMNGIMAGGFKLAFDDSHLILKFAEWLNLLRFRVTRIVYGDHGIFARREKYEAAGGFPPQPLFEDVEFFRRLKKLGKIVMISPPLVTSARRFRAGGVVRTYLKMALLHILYWFKVSPNYLAKLYHLDLAGQGRCGKKRSPKDSSNLKKPDPASRNQTGNS